METCKYEIMSTNENRIIEIANKKKRKVKNVRYGKEIKIRNRGRWETF